MAGWRQAVALAMTGEEIEALTALSRSRTEPAGRVSRAAMLLGYREKPSFFAVGRRLGVHHQTVQRCVERAMAYGALAALDDRPRPGKEPTITPEAKAWLVSLACDKAKEHGYPHELWTTRLLARHARERGPAAGHQCLARLAQGTVCKLLGQEEIKPPVPYFHVVFTVPAPIAAIALQNKAIVYDILLKAAAETIRVISADPQHLGAESGMIAILHTWGQTLTHHPHAHCVVPGGGLAPDGRWVGCRPNFFLPVRVLSRLHRRLFLERLQVAFDKRELEFFGNLARFIEPAARLQIGPAPKLW